MMLSVILLISVISFDQASNLWQQLELASKLESDVGDPVGWGRQWLVDFRAVNTELQSWPKYMRQTLMLV